MEETLSKLSKLETPLTDKILQFISDMFIVFKVFVEKFNLTPVVFEKLPILQGVISPELMTLILTVIIGLTLVYSIFLILINICKFTLNFLVFLKWAAIIILAIGMIYNLMG